MYVSTGKRDRAAVLLLPLHGKRRRSDGHRDRLPAPAAAGGSVPGLPYAEGQWVCAVFHLERGGGGGGGGVPWDSFPPSLVTSFPPPVYVIPCRVFLCGCLW